MNSSAPTVQEPRAAMLPAFDVEAARYALLRRLAPSMRHHLVVNLQPIGMVYEVMDRRLRAPQPNLTEVHEGAHKINSYARAALSSCLDVVTWLAPEEGATTTAVDGVRESLALVATSFTFRGFALRNEVTPVPGKVRQSAFRNVLTGALLYLTDENSPPAEITLAAEAAPEGLRVTLSLKATEGDQGFATAPAYRPLSLQDLQALAQAESVELRRERTQLRLTFPWAAGAP